MLNEKELANCLRFLSIDAIQKANSGHPGMPMGMADITTVLWREFLRHNPVNPKWLNRDRFVISNGHGSMLLYALLHLSGYAISIDDLKNFRQLNSITPGHPEVNETPGVETTTGPLGQGLANAVGMALAEKVLSAQFNRQNFNIIDHYTYVFMGDGCMMEGISHEVASLAGRWQLGKLVAFWDDNHISIDGDTRGWFGDDTPARFEAYHWHVVRDVDGHNPAEIRKAIKEAKFVTDRPSLICCKTTIGYGSPHLAGTSICHGSPLGVEEVAATREKLGWQYEPFVIADEHYAAWNAVPKGEQLENRWQELFADFQQEHSALAGELLRRINKELSANWEKIAADFIAELQRKPASVATRKASQQCLDVYAPYLPELLGGSADLTGSNLTNWSGSVDITKNPAGNYFHYGVREFGMAGIMNGIALHGGFIPYGGTFLVFTDYARSAIRMAALMQQQVIFVLTHDSIGLGEDGPTHQPVEHLAMLRATPGLTVWRPCDQVETAVAWKDAIERKNGPVCMALSRQNVEPQSHENVGDIKKGGYVLVDCGSEPEAIIIATGSEVAIAVKAAELLKHQGKRVRVVSMPCTEIFDQQAIDYQEKVLPEKIAARVAVEAACSYSWYKYVGSSGKIIGIDSFGKSAPAPQLYVDFNITVENIVQTTQNLLN